MCFSGTGEFAKTSIISSIGSWNYIFPVQTYSAATLTVEVKLISYRNPTSEDCNGGNCEGTTSGICDNIFYFCVRAVSNTSCLASVITNDVQDDSIAFSSYDLSRLGISNPLRFSSISTTVIAPCNDYIVAISTSLVTSGSVPCGA